MDEYEIKVKLDLLAEFRAAVDMANLEKQELINSVLTPEIRAKIADIEAESQLMINAAEKNAAALEADIKAAVIENGATVKGAHYQAVYAKGRVSWDNKTLEGLMIAIPQLERARKIGEPSVSLRKV